MVLNKVAGVSLGLDIRVSTKTGTVVTKITPGGIAEATGQFAVGDEVVKINQVR